MQRHLKEAAAPTPSLSVEEEAILLDEGSEAEIAFDSAGDDLERISDINDVANDTTLVVSLTPQVGQVEHDLIGAVADMAVAGTDGDPADVLAIVGDSAGLTTEGIIEALKTMWNAIITSIKNMWVGLKHWLTTYFSSLEQNKKHAEKLIERLNGMKGYTGGKGEVKILDIFDYGGFAGLGLMFSNVFPTEEKLDKLVIDTIDSQFRLMMPIGDGLIDGFGKMKSVPPQQGDVASMDTTDFDKAIQVVTSRLGDYCKKIGMTAKKDSWETPVVGSMKVVAKNFSPSIADAANSELTAQAYLAKVRFVVEQSTDFSPGQSLYVKNDVTPDMLKVQVEGRLKFINELLAIKTGKFDALEKQAEKVQKACEEMIERIKKEDSKAVSIAKSLMPLVTAYTNWATQPAAKLLSVSARHNKFWLSLFEMTVNNYVKP